MSSEPVPVDGAHGVAHLLFRRYGDRTLVIGMIEGTPIPCGDAVVAVEWEALAAEDRTAEYAGQSYLSVINGDGIRPVIPKRRMSLRRAIELCGGLDTR